MKAQMRNAARNAEIVPRGVFQIKKLPFYGSFLSEFFGKADDSVRLGKTAFDMKRAALLVFGRAVARKFRAALFPRPGFARAEQFRGISSAAAGCLHKDSFQIADGRRMRSLHVIPPQSALRKPGGRAALRQQKKRRVFTRQQRGKLL